MHRQRPQYQSAASRGKPQMDFFRGLFNAFALYAGTVVAAISVVEGQLLHALAWSILTAILVFAAFEERDERNGR